MIIMLINLINYKKIDEYIWIVFSQCKTLFIYAMNANKLIINIFCDNIIYIIYILH